ncbi:MAG: phosphatase PAP2 family protein [Bacteroidales bacterium]|nr:phosphatase PAP2 family protein [Bacteroidales bacterium]
MKIKYIIGIILICFCSISSFSISAQNSRPNIDTDLKTLRNDLYPNLSYEFDDFLQYAPAGVMLGMKAFGYESRTGWGRLIVSDAFSVGIMASVVNGLKYTVRRPRPDGSSFNSFPSGHTATAFMTATMLHKEYGWRSPWFSIASYSAATFTGFSRLLNNRHWMSDIVAGAAIGIGSVHLGYFITDKIFKDKQMYDGYEKPVFYYDSSAKHYTAELLFGRRFIIGGEGRKEMGVLPERGSLVGLQTDIPVIAGTGVTARASASSLIYNDYTSSDMISMTFGGYWNYHFAKMLEFQAKAGLGYAWLAKEAGNARKMSDGGIDLTAGVGLSLITDNNFKIKAFADFESISISPAEPWLNTLILGYSAAWFW